ncbi:MAG: EAL domain-containing protein [Hyphomicrobiaceae bacterium]|nr:EAL domain-containing protein [Hyphomicrobiaceae bacterium]
MKPNLLLLQHRILEMVAAGRGIAAAMDDLCRGVEALAPEVVCSVLSIDKDCLQPVAGPSLPEAYMRALKDVPIGPKVGSCGTAAWRGEPVEVTDIQKDPLWADYRNLPLPPEIRACWSSPIKSRDGTVVGTFAFYYRTNRGVNDTEREIIEACLHVCAIVMENARSELELRRLAFRDTVTGLMNRAAFHAAAQTAITEAQRQGREVALHFIDLDEFKSVNDTLGHAVGDALLAAVSQRLRSAVDGQGVVARLGGDEFAILQHGANHEQAADLAWRILSLFDDPFDVGEHHGIACDATIGIALAPHGVTKVDDLLRNADIALYRAKADGRGRYRIFTEGMAVQAQRRRELAADIEKALETEQFWLAYQPIVDLETERTLGFEALLRWEHPERGAVRPAEYIMLAEEQGLIGQIGTWVLNRACKEAVSWPREIGVAVNLSPLQLRDRHLVEKVGQALEQSGLAPHRLTLEITETAILHDEMATRSLVNAISELGVRFALDDFGTGYSSLWSMQAFPIDRMKIDRSFVQDLGSSERALKVVRAMITLSRNLGMAAVAEGVETEEQAAVLRAEHCLQAQGYLYARPLPPDQIAAHLRADWSKPIKVAVR